MSRKHGHYFKSVGHLSEIDVYRVLALWGVSDPCLQHALKKLLCAGQRGAKSAERDVQEAIDSCERWQGMQAENARLPEGDGLAPAEAIERKRPKLTLESKKRKATK